MAYYWTYAQIKTKVTQDLAIEDEDFIQSGEFLGYVNEGIREAEAEIHSLYEDYFLTKATLTLVQGQEEYAFPSNVYANKIRRIMYRNGSDVYTLERLRDWKKFENYTIELINQTSTRYEYLLLNSTAGAPTIVLSPPSKLDGPYVTIWYLREANRLAVDTDICDIPEFVNFVMQYVKVRCYEKEVGHPNLPKAMQDLEQQREQMCGTLAQMVPDADNKIEGDYSTYEEMS